MFQNITMKQSIYHAFIQVMEQNVTTDQAASRLSDGREFLKLVSVTQVTKAAHINRRTFYTYFHDIYDLFDQLEDEYVSGLNQFFYGWEDQDDTMRAVIQAIGDAVDYMSENRRGIKLVATIDTLVFTNLIQEAISNAINVTGGLFNRGKLGADPTKDREWNLNYTTIFLTSGFAWVCYHWMLHPDDFPKDKLKEELGSTFMGAYKLIQSDQLLTSEQMQAYFREHSTVQAKVDAELHCDSQIS